MARDLGVTCTNEAPFYFISYNSGDEERVAEYVQKMTESEISIWYDQAINVGNEWESEIANQIDNCRAVIMFVSENILEKEKSYVKKEFRLAREYSRKPVYIMMLDRVKKADVPIRHRVWWDDVVQLQCINVYSYKKDRVVKSVKSLKEQLDINGTNVQNANHSELIIAGGSYQGEVKENMPHGKGKYISSNKDVYRGDFVDGKFSGNGMLVWTNMDIYKGEFKDGSRTGKGKYTWKNGDMYEGDFVDGNRTGKGKYIWKNGDIYEGDFKDGNRTGNGKLTYADGRIHEGEFRDGVFMEKQSL